MHLHLHAPYGMSFYVSASFHLAFLSEIEKDVVKHVASAELEIMDYSHYNLAIAATK